MIGQLKCQFSMDRRGTQFVLLLTSLTNTAISEAPMHRYFLILIPHGGPVIPQPAWAAAKCINISALLDCPCVNRFIKVLVACGNVSLASMGNRWLCRRAFITITIVHVFILLGVGFHLDFCLDDLAII